MKTGFARLQCFASAEASSCPWGGDCALCWSPRALPVFPLNARAGKAEEEPQETPRGGSGTRRPASLPLVILRLGLEGNKARRIK